MDTKKQAALAAVENKKELLQQVADSIWAYAELSLQEYRSAALYEQVLEEEGFTVEKGICGIETAFSSSFGSGRPVIGILGEYDALSGLSQAGYAIKETPLAPGVPGHGCGHNLLGAGALGAALGVKAYLEETGGPGTVIFYGCPGEEGGAAKAFMAREGLWYGLDAALTWHPDDCNEAAAGSSNACIQVQYLFHGVAAHAAGSPEKGRSALDAVTLMNMGVEFLREHMDTKARIHYAITNAGGCSPNVVPARASVLYLVRSDKVEKTLALQKRVDTIARAAAMMTETTLERKFIDGLAEVVPNTPLEALLHKNLSEQGAPAYTEEELAFAAALEKTFHTEGYVPGAGSCQEAYAAAVRGMQKGPMNDFVMPLFTGDAFSPGSTDVGDVSWQCPTAQLHVAAWPNGCPGHSWQNVSCGKSPLGYKALLKAAQVLCGAAIDLLEQPELLSAAREEFAARTAGGYHCPIPAEAVPNLPELG